jgi:hypothetical protein
MTSHVGRLYALAVSVLGLFLAWAGIAAHPWRQSAPAPAAVPLAQYQTAQYQARLRADARLVSQLAGLRKRAAAVPQVRVVTLPPIVTTRTS